MTPIVDTIKNSLHDKDVIVINTHFHWDHVWGNCVFKGNSIISHTLCRKRLDENWDKQIYKNKRYLSGAAEKTLPTITFDKRITFENEGIELFYSSGHTEGSISVFDCQERTLYVGDNLEKPIIYVENNDIPTYIDTLKNYLSYHPPKIMAGHTLDLDESDIQNTIDYLTDLSLCKKD